MITKRQTRINDPKTIDFEFIEKELFDNKHVIVQFSGSISNDKIFDQLNDLCVKYDNSLGIRFYGNYSEPFDFKTLLKIPNVKCLYVDCLTKANNVLILKELKNLENLSLGVFDIQDTEILNLDNLKKLSELIITETRTKALNLDYLREYSYLQKLIIGGHTKNINAVGELSKLQYLSLNSVKKVPISFINNLKSLKTLKFILGSRDNINEIEDNEIETLEIVWVRGFCDLSNISKFKKIENLLIEDNIQLSKIHFDSVLPELKDFKILNCKTMSSLTGMENLTSLNQLRIYKTDLNVKNILNQKLSNKLRIFAFYTTKKKIDEEIKVQLDKLGYREFS